MNTISTNILDTEDSKNKAEGAVSLSSTPTLGPGQRSSFQLTEKTLFRLSLSVSSFDPLREMLGFFYESILRRECAMTLNGPIRSNDFIGIRNVIRRRRRNPEFFQCTAIDIVLINLLRATSTNHDYSKG